MDPDEFIHTLHPEKKKSHVVSLLAGFFVGLFIVALIFFMSSGGGLTGQIVWEPTTINETTEIPLNVTNITKLSVTGVLTGGTGEITLFTDDAVLTVYSGDTTPSRISTSMESYALGETITIVVDADDYTLWLTDEFGNKTPINETINPTSGEYELAALINETGGMSKETIMVLVREDTDTSLDILRTAPVNEFVNYCDETCIVPPSNEYLLVITPGSGAELHVDEIIVTEEENTEPIVVAKIPDVELNVGETTTINLAGYFADDDVLVYDINNMIGIDEEINNGVLTLTAVAGGSYNAIVYASDLQNLVQNSFTIRVTEVIDVAENATNVTIETNTTTENITNETIVVPPATNVTNTTEILVTNITRVDCSDPDPNKRPLECIQSDVNYFVEQEILLENIDRKLVGKFTPIGNLLITGDYVEHSNAVPSSNDWSIGYIDGFSQFTPTIWIDGDTGDLHMRGQLIEANTNIVHKEGMYGMTNARGIVLALANRQNGDFTIRGNVIPYRRSLE